MSGDLKLCEIDMPYEEREGKSKLRIGGDGLRFLRSILDMTFLYEPWRPLGAVAVSSLAVAIALMVTPAIHYIRHGSLEEWMIYRFIVSHLAGTNAVLMLAAAYVTGRIARIALVRKPRPNALEHLLGRPYFGLIPLVLMLVGGLLVLPSFLQLVRTGSTYEHWSRFIAMSFLFSTALVLFATWAIHYVLELLDDQLKYLRSLRQVHAEDSEARTREHPVSHNL